MIDHIAELQEGLKVQLASLSSDIRNAEVALLNGKEGYLKVQGAIEILDVLNNKINVSNSVEATEE